MKLSEILLLSAIVLTAGCTDQIVREYEENTPPDIDFESVEINGEYEIVSEDETEWIVYRHEGERYSSPHFAGLEPAAGWIADNTEDNETVASWWDYGHDIRAQTGNKMYLVEPSEYAAEKTVEGPIFGLRENYSSQSKINKMLDIFNSPPEEAISVAREEGIEYILFSRSDLYKFNVIQKAGNSSDSNGRITSGGCVSNCAGINRTFRFDRETRVQVNMEEKTVEGDLSRCSESESGSKCVVVAFEEVYMADEESKDSFFVKALSGRTRLEKVYSGDYAVILRVDG